MTPDRPLLGWEDGTAAMKLGATPELVKRWRKEADPPSYIAAHVRTLVDIVDGRRPRLGWRVEAVGSRGQEARATAAADRPRTIVVSRSR